MINELPTSMYLFIIKESATLSDQSTAQCNVCFELGQTFGHGTIKLILP